jgi:hypothetical protein
MERIDQGLNLHKISLRMQVPVEWKILETLQLRKSVFPTTRPDARVRTPSLESQSYEGPYGAADVSHKENLSTRSPDGPTDVSHRENSSARRSEQNSRREPQRESVCKKSGQPSTHELQRAPVCKKVRTLMQWLQTMEVLCNSLDAMVASPDALQWLLKVLVASLDAAYLNSSLSRIRISEAYLKMLIGCVIFRIP